MNIALEHCEEILDDNKTKKYGDVFLRGNNGKKLFKRISTLYKFVSR